jgi:PAS domain S-box-containing protein
MKDTSRTLRFAVALLAVVAATGLKLMLASSLGNRLIFITFFPAIVVASIYGGLWPGMLSLVLSSVAAVFASDLQVIFDPAANLGIVIFILDGLIIIGVCESMRQSRRRAFEASEGHRRADAASAESESRFRVMADAAPVLIWMSDTAGQCTWFNKQWLEFVGSTIEQQRGQGWLENVHPDDRERCVSAYLERFNQRLPFAMDYRLRRTDGEYRWLLNTGQPLFDRDQRFIGYIGSCLDITDLKSTQEALAESEERLRLGLSAGATGTWDWDIVNNRVSWSEKLYEFYGTTPDQFDGTIESFGRLLHPEDQPRADQAIRACIENHSEYHLEFRIVRPDGATRWLSTSGHAFYDAQSRPIRMMGATIDITDRKLAEQQREALLAREQEARGEAERLGRLKDEFLATLSHELRTPLNAILGWAQVLKRRPDDRAEVEEGLGIIERNARVQTQLIEDLLDMSRIISGKLRLDVARVDLPAVIENAVQSLRHSAEAKEITITTTLDAQASDIRGDAARMQQIVWNLLSNAIKFTRRGGHVQVTLQRVESQIEIAVADDGIGLEPAFVPHLFERFRQADSSTTRHHAGLGLGLAIVKHLVELHGGTVQAESEGKDKGATFRVRLPIPIIQETRPPADASPALTDNGDGIWLRDMKVLVVDDEPDARLLVERVLADAGAIVQSAASAKDAMDVLSTQPLDLLISDIGMPETDGYTLLSELRRNTRGLNANLPAIALTAFARSEDRRRAMMAGFDIFVSKPVDGSELLAVAARLSRRQGAS